MTTISIRESLLEHIEQLYTTNKPMTPQLSLGVRHLLNCTFDMVPDSDGLIEFRAPEDLANLIINTIRFFSINMTHTIEIINPDALQDVPGIQILSLKDSCNGFTDATISVHSDSAYQYLESIGFQDMTLC